MANAEFPSQTLSQPAWWWWRRSQLSRITLNKQCIASPTRRHSYADYCCSNICRVQSAGACTQNVAILVSIVIYICIPKSVPAAATETESWSEMWANIIVPNDVSINQTPNHHIMFMQIIWLIITIIFNDSRQSWRHIHCIFIQTSSFICIFHSSSPFSHYGMQIQVN